MKVINRDLIMNKVLNVDLSEESFHAEDFPIS
jgi:hypothetical protein